MVNSTFAKWIILSKGRQLPLPGANIFQKTVDKSKIVCYNVDTTNERN